MNRREFIKKTGCWAALSTVPGFSLIRPSKPNLLIIHTDEHNFRTLGCYRDTLPPEQAFMWGREAVVETPNIDWIARHGALCTRFYATTPVCSPSRASLMTGRYPHNTDVITNDIPMRDGLSTFAHILSENGYATGYAGKWHLDGTGKPQWAPARNFGFVDNRYMYNRGHWKQLEIGPEGPCVKARKKGKPSYDVAGADKKSFTTDFLTDRTVEFIEAHKDTPFCYMLSIPDPHGPDTVRAPYDKMYDNMSFTKPRTFDKPENGVPSWAMKKKKCGYGQSKYFGMVKCIDDNVGKLLDCLRTNDLLDNTIVVFTADHGDLRGEHHRHNKGVPLEASARIPFVLYYPEKVKAGSLIHEALGTVDFLPTIIDLMGFKTHGQEEGRNACSLFVSGEKPGHWKDATFVRGTGLAHENWLAAVTSRYKLVLSPKDDPWLIDLEKDPDELTNFIAKPEYNDTVRTLARELLDYGKRTSDPRVQDASILTCLENLLQENRQVK